jgi:hypothetical protein
VRSRGRAPTIRGPGSCSGLLNTQASNRGNAASDDCKIFRQGRGLERCRDSLPKAIRNSAPAAFLQTSRENTVKFLDSCDFLVEVVRIWLIPPTT